MSMKAIVVGGGPVGLTAAHALTHAGIDFVVLESRPEIVIDAGSNLVLLPMALRPLYQLGLEKALKSVTSELTTMQRFDYEGRDIGTMHWFEHAEKLTGCLPRVVSRQDLTKVLFESLPEESQAKILPNKRVSTVTTTSDGLVTVTCRDETSYTGSFVVGADGAHSVIRGQMRNLALESGSSAVNEENPYLTTYRCLWIRTPSGLSTGLKPGTTCETHGDGAATQLFAGEGTAVMGIYQRLDKPTKDRLRYTQADQDAMVEELGHIPLLPENNLSLREAYENRLQSGLVSLEEGVLDHWSWDGRIVLAGDAAHKFTPSTGAGCNNGIIDVIALSNEIAKVVNKVGFHPSTEEMASAFEEYHRARYPAVVQGCQESGNATAMATWMNGTLKFVDRYIFSIGIFQRVMAARGAQKVAATPAFDYIQGEESVVGSVPWVKPIPQGTAKA